MDIKNAQKIVDDWINEHGVRYFNELTNMAQLTEEVGEVARIIARRYGEQSEKESDKGKTLEKNWRMFYLWYYVWQTKQVSICKKHLIKEWIRKQNEIMIGTIITKN